ncbi:glycosyltransferase [Promicromonospora thailandica]|uniref:4,4'-diaponeurosporenoate glycosyltransferase n=1 Tax=Promicromonospora thailandica TaxID=765201 RepID=A0A9X2G7Z9_9MICO|nr:glycosyltransferase [Promicromonospora thailandica]MCP2264894.1 Glycosyl transferase family 2 [Promicromonospora thailandica]BFF18838.1 glycosyltransferase [Promicromonospora thailandica]
MTGRVPVASVVIPAHDEERTIGRLLEALCADPGLLEIVVACNGCTDGTARVAGLYPVRVLDLPEPSKAAALRAGDLAARTYPRVYLDADVEITAQGVARLAEVVAGGEPGGVAVAAPSRTLPRTGVTLLARWYYDVWEALPAVRTGLFGRGVLAVSREGVRRVAALPQVMADDLVLSEAFAPAERVVVQDVAVVVHPARTLGDLVRRRARVTTGNVQADRAGLRGAEARTGLGDLWQVVRERPLLAPRVPVFLAVVLAGRLRARRAVRAADFTTWERDTSSRA